jgi:hypothetical protein
MGSVVWVLTVLLTTSEPYKIFHTEKFNSAEECYKWAQFYNEYPFKPTCTKEK